MSRHKIIALLAASLLAQRLSAEEPAASPNAESPVIQTTLRVEERAGHEPTRHVLVSFGTNKFAFVMANDFRLDTVNAEKLVLVTKDFSRLISLRIVAPIVPLLPETQREALLAEYPGAKILEAFSRSAANQSGPAFDLQCSTGGVVRSARVAFIPSPVGVLEFTLLTSPETFRAGQADLDFILQTLRVSDAAGELKIIQFADRS